MSGLCWKKTISRYGRAGRPISVSAVLLGPGINICRFFGCMFRAPCALFGGLDRFMPFGIGANHCCLWNIGWEQCGQGLTSRPRETSVILVPLNCCAC